MDRHLRYDLAGGKSIWADFLNPRVSDLLFKTEAGTLWHCRYSKRPPIAAKTWVGLGVRFPDQSGWYEGLALPSGPHSIFIVGSDAGEVECDVALPRDWIRDDEDGHFLPARSVDSFGDRPDERTEKLQTWGESAMEGAGVILRNCRIT